MRALLTFRRSTGSRRILAGEFVKSAYAKRRLVQSVVCRRKQPRSRQRPTAAATCGSRAIEDIVAVKVLVNRFGKVSPTRLVEVL
jgi:hypothetical protein